MAEENALTRKVGGLPVWGWVGIGVVGFVFVYRYMKSKSSSTTSTTTATGSVSTSSAVGTQAAGSYGGGNSGQTGQVLSSVLSQLQALQNPTTTTSSGVPYATEVQYGGGYFPKTGNTTNAGRYVTGTTGGNFVWLSSPAQEANVSKTTLYIQPVPGKFVKLGSGTGKNTGPVFTKV